MQLEMPLHPLPTMVTVAPSMPAASGSDLVPDINDVEPDDDMDVDSEDDAAHMRLPSLPSAGGQPQARLGTSGGAGRMQRAGQQ
eukprot:12235491-Alexandrium_andersonii.AAC.1